MWNEHLAACEFADRRIFKGNIQTINKDDEAYSLWLHYYDSYFMMRRAQARRAMAQLGSSWRGS